MLSNLPSGQLYNSSMPPGQSATIQPNQAPPRQAHQQQHEPHAWNTNKYINYQKNAATEKSNQSFNDPNMMYHPPSKKPRHSMKTHGQPNYNKQPTNMQHLFNPNEALDYGQQQQSFAPIIPNISRNSYQPAKCGETPGWNDPLGQQQQSFAPIIPNISRNSYQPAKCGGTPGWNDPPPMNSLPPQKQHSLKKYPRPVDPSIQNNVPPVNQYSQYGYCNNQNTGAGSLQWNVPSNQYSQHGYGSSSQNVPGTQWNVPSSDQHPQYGGNGDGSGAQWTAPSVNQHPQYGYDGNQSSTGVGGGAQWNTPPVNQFPQHGYNGNQPQSNNGDGGAYPWNSGPKY
uniref:Enamelin n=1 Tax=Panagrolaimus davidi TaxID=227884 RepID=A0A914QHB2_9BILA